MMKARLTSPQVRALDEGWQLTSTAANAIASAEEAEAAMESDPGIPVRVPCTVASALRDAGQVDEANPEPLASLDAQDHWFRTDFAVSEGERARTSLYFGGLATIAEVWLNGTAILQSDSMFLSHEVDVSDVLEESNVLWICFRALAPRLKEKRPRAKWRTRLVSERNLRFFRTSLFGRIESIGPPIPPVGPWRAIELRRAPVEDCVIQTNRLRPVLVGSEGRVDFLAECRVDPARHPSEFGFSLEIEGERFPLTAESIEAGTLRLHGVASIDHIEPWRPHTQLAPGESPRRYAVALLGNVGGDETRLELGLVGFRSIEVVSGDRFALTVNGERTFCRGTCWTPVDAYALDASADETRAALEDAVAAGMNMLRVTGTTAYESDAFYALCDELGILVWQDFMFATLDYPTDDPDFRAAVESEVEQFLERTASNACLAVFCGNSEGRQQPAMLGLEPEVWASEFFDDALPEIGTELRPDVPYRASTPMGGAMPFHPEVGTAHYFGVGAYRRGLDDAQLAKPAFMTECLTFAQPPGLLGADLSNPERVPQDRGTDWDFADVTRFYRDRLFADARSRTDPARADFQSRVALTEVMERSQVRWRDTRADCGGSLVLMHRDSWDCAGWGVFDHRGEAKASLYGLARAWAPVGVALLDEGLSGIRCRIMNDRAEALSTRLDLALLRVDGTEIEAASVGVRVAAGGSWEASVESLLGGFLDAGHAYGFGEPAFDLCVATLADRAGTPGGQAIILPGPPRQDPLESLGLHARWIETGAGGSQASWALEVGSERFARAVAVDLDGGRLADNFFPLAPHRTRVLDVEIRSEKGLGGVRIGAVNGTDEWVLDPPRGTS